MKRIKLNNTIVLILSVCIILNLTACGEAKVPDTQVLEETEDLVVVGFSQVGAESDWRRANTQSMKDTFTRENGYELIFSDAQQKQSNQITTIRTFIQREVDYIVLAPVTEDGWDTVLSEAKEANIPVIVVDRQVNVSDDSLFDCWVGSNFRLEGEKVGEWLHRYFVQNEIDESGVNIVNIKGTLGASSQIGRSGGLSISARKYNWNLLAEAEGEYTQARAREVMTNLLNKYDNINVVYCENDNEAFGVIEAIESAGLKIGPDIADGQIMIVSFDGVSEQAIELAKEGKISCIGECNPLHGPRVREIIESLEKGVRPEKFEYVDESIYSSIDSIREIQVDEKDYPITILK